MRFRPHLHAHRGRLIHDHEKGQPVHAGSFLRERRIVVDAELLRDEEELRRILLHEIFHFVWLRLGNGRRASYAELLIRELRDGVAGELGWSSEWRKTGLSAKLGRRWREYLCESFCDTAAFLYSGLKAHDEFRLGARWRKKRAVWFRTEIDGRRLPV